METAKKIAKILLIASIFILAFSYFKKDNLPSVKEINSQLLLEPIQQETTEPPFSIQKGELTYNLIPRFNYTIQGLVVADYDSENWLDYTHRNDKINTKDLCLIWGSNVKTNIFQNMIFSHGEFTCYYKNSNKMEYYPANEDEEFKPFLISNSHLLPKNDEIYKNIKESSIGDQVYIKGMLVDYSYKPNGASGPWTRNTSTIRTDTGNGACEIIYVTEFKILKKVNNLFRSLYNFSIFLTAACLIFIVVSFFLSTRRKPPPPPKTPGLYPATPKFRQF